MNLSNNYFKPTSDSEPAIIASNRGFTVSNSGSIIHFYANILFPSFYKIASSRKIWIGTKKLVSNKSIFFITLYCYYFGAFIGKFHPLLMYNLFSIMK